MVKRESIVLSIFFLLFMLLGSTLAVSVAEPGSHLTLLRKDVSDVNGDGIYDFATYTFLPIEYKHATVQKIILVSPEWNLSDINVNLTEPGEGIVLRYHIDNSSVFDKIDEHINTFDRLRSNEETIRGEAQCKQYLGLGRKDLPCTDINSCSIACQGAPICKQMYMGIGQQFIQDLLDLQDGFNAMDSEVSHLRFLTDELRNNSSDIPKSLIEGYLATIEKISYIGTKINNNPIINVYNTGEGKGYSYGGLCNVINYDTDELQTIYNLLTTNLVIETTHQNKIHIKKETPKYSEVTYKVILLIDFKSKGIYENALIYDDLPKGLNYWDVNINSNFTTIENKSVVWNIKKIGTGERLQSYVVYSFKSDKILDQSEISDKMSTPKIKVYEFSVTNSPYLAPVFSIISEVFTVVRPNTNYYIALSIAIFILIIILKVIIIILTLIWDVILGLLTRKGIMNSIKIWVGHGSPTFWQYLLIGFILTVLGVGFSLYLDGESPYNLDYSSVGYVMKDNAVQSILSTIILIGLLTFVFSLEDGLRGKLGGFSVSSKKKLIKRNLKDLSELKKKIADTNDLIREAKKYHINTSDEESCIFSIPIKRIDKLVTEINDQRTAKNLIEESLARVDMGYKSLKEKIKNAKHYAGLAELQFDRMLEESGRINIDSLVNIPKEWRDWAVEYYILHHPENNLVIDNRTVKVATPIMAEKKTIIDIVRILSEAGVKKMMIHSIKGEVKSYKVDNVNQEYLFMLLNKIRKIIQPIVKHPYYYIFLRTRTSTLFIWFLLDKGLIISLVSEEDKTVNCFLEMMQKISDRL